MAHEVETMAWTNEKPWHGLGVSVSNNLTVDEMLEKAGLNWTVEQRPMFTLDQNGSHIPVKGQRALVRNTDNRILTTTGNRWHPVQNRDAFEFFKQFVDSTDITMETAGSLRQGQVVWGLANLGSGFTLPGTTDTLKGYVLLMSPHIQGRSVIAQCVTTRVVCANTLAIALNEKGQHSYTHSHVRAFNPKEAAEMVGLARSAMSEFERNVALLTKLNLTQAEVFAILAPVYQPQTTDLVQLSDPAEQNPSLRSVLASYTDAPGATPGTGWGLLNAVTYHADHRAGKNPDARLTSAWTGTEAARKTKVLASLLALAA